MITQLKHKLVIGAAAATMIFGGVGATALVAYAQGGPTNTPPAQTQPQDPIRTDAQDNIQDPSYNGSITVDQAQTDGTSEADEAAALQDKATLSAADAEAAALAANPGTTVVKTELDNENGVLVYSVELSNGQDVKVDAGNATILHSEQAGNDSVESGDTDTVQEETQQEQGSQANDGAEAPGVEDAAGQ